MATDIRVIGVGNDFRSDDAIGLKVAREIRQKSLEGVAVEEVQGDGTKLMDAWSGANRVIIIDAVSSNQKPGTIHRIDPRKMEISLQMFRSSTHHFGLTEAIALARQYDCLPDDVVIYGVEGGNFAPGTRLTDEVASSIPKLVTIIESELEALRRA